MKEKFKKTVGKCKNWAKKNKYLLIDLGLVGGVAYVWYGVGRMKGMQDVLTKSTLTPIVQKTDDGNIFGIRETYGLLSYEQWTSRDYTLNEIIPLIEDLK